jgi:hypothetical protein
VPTIQKPQLDHTSFAWHAQSDRFHKELEAHRGQILEQSGFNRAFGDPDGAPSINTENEGAKFILELTGILSQAAAIKMDGGYKPTNKVIATLRSIEKNPSLIHAGGIEPEALAVVASSYQRGEEKPGTFWFDVDPSGDKGISNPQSVSKAASVAIDKLKGASTRAGRPAEVMLDFLGSRLLACYLRFNLTAGRHSVAADAGRAQAESGPFLEFLSLVIAPLNRFLVELPASYGAKAISGPELARRALRSRGQTRIHRVRKFLVRFFSISPKIPHN